MGFAQRLYLVVSCLNPAAMTMPMCRFSALFYVAASMELTKDNWDSAVAGKSVFVKFQAPW